MTVNPKRGDILRYKRNGLVLVTPLNVRDSQTAPESESLFLVWLLVVENNKSGRIKTDNPLRII